MQALREINWACWLSPLTLLVVLGQQAAGSERAPSVSAVVSQRAQPVLVRHSRNPIKQITIAVVDDFPAVEGVCSEKLRIALVGDSTVASYPNPPADRPDLTGWGQVLFEYLTDRATVSNHAASGRSSKSFLAEGRWPAWSPNACQTSCRNFAT